MTTSRDFSGPWGNSLQLLHRPKACSCRMTDQLVICGKDVKQLGTNGTTICLPETRELFAPSRVQPHSGTVGEGGGGYSFFRYGPGRYRHLSRRFCRHCVVTKFAPRCPVVKFRELCAELADFIVLSRGRWALS